MHRKGITKKIRKEKSELHTEYYQSNREKLNTYMREYNKKKKAQEHEHKIENVEVIDPTDNIDTE